MLSAVVMPFLACLLLYYLGGLESTGSLIRMIIKIIHGIKGLMWILVIMIVFFAGSYTVLFHSDPVYEYEGFDGSLLTVYGFLFGGYDVQVFETSTSPSLAKFLVSIFMFVVVIVFLNLLIALMGDIFDEVQSKAEEESTYARAKLIVQYESLFSTSYKKRNEKELYPAWIHVLRKGKEDEDDKNQDEGWKGRTEELRREILKQEKHILKQEKNIFELKKDNLEIKNMLTHLIRKLT